MSDRKTKREIENLIREFVLLELEDAPERKENDINQLSDDSLDLAVDRSIGNFEKDAKGQDGQLDLNKFVSGLAGFADHMPEQLDLKGVLVRRVANFVSKNYDPKMSKEVLRMLEDTFGLSTDPSYHQSEPELSNIPVAKNGGPDANGPGGAPPA
jgi:hypothetical protein